ncbi:glycosyl hydrolase family 71 protein [Delphinella strobiligena]|nr:glycosyl hydrolase family 71 protein [Delphinella strobiligena]
MVSPKNLSLAAIALFDALIAPVACHHEVFAHLIIGNTYNYTQQDFLTSIQAAHTAGIDGFALDIALPANFSSTDTSLDDIYAAAEQYDHDFTLFLSFDYGVVPNWDPLTVVTYINRYSNSSAQFKYNGKPFVSTFEGWEHASDWASIKTQTGAFFIPDYSSQGASGAAALPNVDGLLSWDAWPNYTADVPTTDQEYMTALDGRPYMMPVSPWFYANVDGKNWLWHTDELWPLRWEQVFKYNPTFIELLTWNDWGESHYLGPLPPYVADIPSEAVWYSEYIPHNAWLNDLPYYIAKYKNDGAEPAASSYTPHITFWYRLNPKSACSDDGTTCNSASNGQTTYPATDCATDAVFFSIFTPSTATVNVSIGGTAQTAQTADSAGLFHGSFPLDGNTGAVVISANLSDGSTLGPVAGPGITTVCAYPDNSGNVNWNAWVGGS